MAFTECEGYSKNNVYSTNEARTFTKSLPQKLLVSARETDAPRFKISKDRDTVMICANASGIHSLLLLMIGKSKEILLFKKCHLLSCHYMVQKVHG